ncbi:MAG: STAS domain-containing protein [Synergistaceae bacterium]|jgi:anti-anti-sigma factor|nr:STAS domain-containing protein [Synergistaceae bacterium]
MEVNVQMNGGAYLLDLSGKLDGVGEPVLQKYIDSIFEGEEGKESKISAASICINFQEVDFVSSAGLRVLLRTAKIAEKRGWDLTLKNLNDSVRMVLDMTGFMRIMKIEE